MLVRTLVADDGEHQLMYIDLTGPEPLIEPFGGIERHSTIFIDGRVALSRSAPDAPMLPYLLTSTNM